jgi:hypothetical protein
MRNKIAIGNGVQHSLLAPYQQESKQSKTSKLCSAFDRAWQHLLTNLNQGSELKIWQTSDCWGNTWWHAYNPANGCSATRESETEILAWVDRRQANE